MSDIKLFQIDGNQVRELQGGPTTLEKSLQTLIEQNLENLLGVRFLASEHTTGKTHGGRIDTLGLDENGCPVIIEYKRAINENVINQGLFYLDWLMDHKGELTLLVQKVLGAEAAESIEWSSPRLLCIAGDFTKYDEHAVQQIKRNIELLRYRKYDAGLLLLELVNATFPEAEPTETVGGPKPAYSVFEEKLAKSSNDLKNLYADLAAYMHALGDDIQVKTLKYYVAFKRLRNFACVEVYPQSNKLVVYIQLNPDKIAYESSFTRDVSKTGHYGTGGVEITIHSLNDLEKAKPLIMASYEGVG
ncbi:DUF5655 domain-containing protein [Candidatus Neomarinimicrobiota bacterium]